MRAKLFFSMLRHGRVIERRKRMTHYVEMCRVSCYPKYTEDSQKRVMQYFYDSSLSPADWAKRERFRQKMEAEAAKHYVKTEDVLAFFKGQKGGVNVKR
jgi:hypothetical protein